jgi:hypothetical protein
MCDEDIFARRNCMSTRIQNTPASGGMLSYIQSAFSMPSLLKVALCAFAVLQPGNAISRPYDQRGTLPHYCVSRNDLSKLKVPYDQGITPDVFCYFNNEEYLRGYTSGSRGEDRLLAQFSLGQRLACPYRTFGPYSMPRSAFEKLVQSQKTRHLQGLKLMDQSGCLEIIYPERGESYQECVASIRTARQRLNYEIEGCTYFTDGTLVCPDCETFERLRNQFLRQDVSEYVI